jgi:hypothetical protein
LIQAIVRSTTQRLGMTSKPLAWAERLTTSIRHLAQLFAAVGAIGEDRLQKGKEPAGLAVQDQKRAIAVLQVGRVDDDGEDQAEGVDEQMALLAFDLLARVIARRVDARPPFSAPFTLWLSITPALGLAARLSRSRVIR